MTMPKDTIRQEFMNEWAGENPGLGIRLIHSRIADWWLAKFEAHYSDITKKIREKLTEERADFIEFGLQRTEGKIDALMEVLSLLSPSSDNKQDNG